MIIACDYCHKTVDPEAATVWAEVTVWVHGPKRNGACLQGGDTGRYMHDHCAQLHKRGIPAGQERLL